jgi:hypothetical protein
MYNNLFFEFSLGITLEPEYIAILDYASFRGYELPTRNQTYLNNKKIKKLKVEGIFSELDILYNFKQEAGLDEFSKINWINPGVYNATQSNIINSPTFEPNQGFKGGTNSYFLTNYIPSIDANNALLEDVGVFYKTYDEIQGVVAGTRNGSGNNFVFRKFNPSGGNITTFHAGSSEGLSVFDDNSHIVHSKYGLTQSYYVDGVLSNTGTYSGTFLSTVPITLFAWNLNGTIGQNFEGGIEYFALGSSYIGTKANELKDIFQ